MGSRMPIFPCACAFDGDSDTRNGWFPKRSRGLDVLVMQVRCVSGKRGYPFASGRHHACRMSKLSEAIAKKRPQLVFCGVSDIEPDVRHELIIKGK